MKIMRPIASTHMPTDHEDFLYEVKYDGFRCLLMWDDQDIKLMSRQQKDLTLQFPEIVQFCHTYREKLQQFLPLVLDCELVILNNNIQANFSAIQTRGRLKTLEKIEQEAKRRPAHVMVFDLLQMSGKDHTHQTIEKRKLILKKIFDEVQIGTRSHHLLQYVQSYDEPEHLQQIIFNHQGEGIVAKRKNSLYVNDKNHHDWFKIKNWRTIHGCVTTFDPNNGYFTISVKDHGEFRSIGKCKHGLDDQTREALKTMFLTKGKQKSDGTYTLPPAICAAIHTLEMTDDDFREPEFSHLLLEALPEGCTMEKVLFDMAQFPKTVELSNEDKVFWPRDHVTKGDLLIFLRYIAPYMLPFLAKRALTIIRCPDGVEAESFFQKSLPTYAPDFINRTQDKDKQLIICDSVDSLVWFANHGSIEYHIPFQYVNNDHPVEIAFDLDPPDRSAFHLAIQAARLIKQILDDLDVISFVKTSGNKGLQIHIPLEQGMMTYEETAIFTEAIALTITQAFPHMFTTERLKKHRHGRLYIDYLQHGRDKTLIAPYSPRMTDDATVATPLFWEEVKEGLNPASFTVKNVIKRVKTDGCPWTEYKEAGKTQVLDKVLQLIH